MNSFAGAGTGVYSREVDDGQPQELNNCQSCCSDRRVLQTSVEEPRCQQLCRFCRQQESQGALLVVWHWTAECSALQLMVWFQCAYAASKDTDWHRFPRGPS